MLFDAQSNLELKKLKQEMSSDWKELIDKFNDLREKNSCDLDALEAWLKLLEQKNFFVMESSGQSRMYDLEKLMDKLRASNSHVKILWQNDWKKLPLSLDGWQFISLSRNDETTLNQCERQVVDQRLLRVYELLEFNSSETHIHETSSQKETPKQNLEQNENCSPKPSLRISQQENIFFYASDLDWVAWFLKEEEKADLTQLRIYWYEECEINNWVHFSVWVKTMQYLICDYLIPLYWQKIIDCFQSMEKERLPKIK